MEITSDFYEEKIKQYDNQTIEMEEKIQRVEKIENDFYITAGYIIELTKHSSQLFELSEEDERRLLIKTVLLNIRWDGEKLLYDYNSPFDLIVQLNEGTTWGPLYDIIMNLEPEQVSLIDRIVSILNINYKINEHMA